MYHNPKLKLRVTAISTWIEQRTAGESDITSTSTSPSPERQMRNATMQRGSWHGRQLVLFSMYRQLCLSLFKLEDSIQMLIYSSTRVEASVLEVVALK
jgi:hypothetical protein